MYSRLLILITALVVTTAPALGQNVDNPHRPYDPDPDTFILYHFDDGAGGTATDASQHDYHGTLHGATWTEDGKFGGALEFDGTADVATPFLETWFDGSLTLEAWIYPTAWEAGVTVIDGGWSLRPIGGGHGLLADDGGKPWAVEWYGHDPPSMVYAEQSLPLFEWSHVAAMFDEERSLLQLSINGLEVASSGNYPGSQYNWFVVGKAMSQAGSGFVGKIDEVRISSTSRAHHPIATEATSWGRVKTRF